MIEISDEQFSSMISEVMDELPQQYIEGLKNVVVTYEDDPTPEQRLKQGLTKHQTLYGLYEGVPLTKRGIGYNMVLPDRITIFKNPIRHNSSDMTSLRAQVKHTLWHEIAHFYGLDHDRIHKIEHNWH